MDWKAATPVHRRPRNDSQVFAGAVVQVVGVGVTAEHDNDATFGKLPAQVHRLTRDLSSLPGHPYDQRSQEVFQQDGEARSFSRITCQLEPAPVDGGKYRVHQLVSVSHHDFELSCEIVVVIGDDDG